MIKAVVFDADGVLINGEIFSVSLEQDYGISQETTKPFFIGPFRDCLIGKADLREVILPYLTKWGWNKGVDALLEYWFESEHSLNKELIESIQQLRQKGIKCCLATNQEKHRFQYMLDNMNFDNIFDTVYASAYLGYKKPSLDFYSKIVDDLPNIKKNEILFWDDDFENVKGAKEYGINAELFTTFKDFEQKINKYIN